MEQQGPIRILLVEDDQQLRNILRLALEGEGYECIETQDGQDAIDLLMTGQSVDLIVTDHQMPRMTGLGVVKWVRSHSTFSGIPVLLYSGQMDSDLTHQAQQAGSTAVLTKPFLLQDLLTLVEKLLTPTAGS